MTTFEKGVFTESSGEPSLKHKLLCYFFTHPKAQHYLRELAALLDVDPANLSRELKKLQQEGVFSIQKIGNQKHFSLNPHYELYEELRSVVEKKWLPETSQASSTKAQVYVIAGPNGSGKTTFAKRFLPESLGLKTFINADLIAGGIAPLDVEGAAIKAGKLLLKEIKSAYEKGIDFAFETTLSGKSYLHLFKHLIARHYGIHVLFLWIPSMELSIKRVRDRVKRGGHNIPEPVIRRRFHRGIKNLFQIYAPLLSSWSLYDNSGLNPKLIAYRVKEEEQVVEPEIYSEIQKIAGVS